MACQSACACTGSSAEMPSPEEAKGHVADGLAFLLEALDIESNAGVKLLEQQMKVHAKIYSILK